MTIRASHHSVYFCLKDCINDVASRLRSSGSYYHQILLDSESESYLLEVSGCRGQAQVGIKIFLGWVYLDCYIS